MSEVPLYVAVVLLAFYLTQSVLNVVLQKSPPPHKSVHLSVTFTNMEYVDRFVGEMTPAKRLQKYFEVEQILQSDFQNTLCEINLICGCVGRLTRRARCSTRNRLWSTITPSPAT